MKPEHNSPTNYQQDWYYTHNGKQTGPITFVRLMRLADLGELVESDLVWSEGMAKWEPASSINGLFDDVPIKPVIPLEKNKLPVIPKEQNSHPVIISEQAKSPIIAREQIKPSEIINEQAKRKALLENFASFIIGPSATKLNERQIERKALRKYFAPPPSKKIRIILVVGFLCIICGLILEK